ncbi:VOC family protein [Georgenia subflava]|uniref:VOC family protein n=1 Tax=Georgenia subflava TaxID=1622177 RepID=A0A6N7EFU8_9MICO|nr:VOC family protein [Georgenia subflava]MPV37272.1 VOC family protein [Georgenia subflava]
MLSTYNPVPALAVKDLAAAREFYEGTLGFAAGETFEGEGLMYKAGAGQLMVYVSAYAGTNKATAVSFQVPADAFDDEVAALRSAGVEFQTFEMDGMTWDDGVATVSGMDAKAVWFTDPDGNILNLESSS